MADELQADVFPEYRVALLHGRLKPDEKDRVMAAFARGDVHVLVSTTVVEVGVDVPNATVMVVEHAERFGLSQLHQLRGPGRPRRARLDVRAAVSVRRAATTRARGSTRSSRRAMASRSPSAISSCAGPGDFFGTRQSGVPTLRVGDLAARSRADGRGAARRRRAWLDRDGPGEACSSYLNRTWAERFGLVGVG